MDIPGPPQQRKGVQIHDRKQPTGGLVGLGCSGRGPSAVFPQEVPRRIGGPARGRALAAVLPRAAQAHTTGNPPTDVDVLNYALTLEHLEYAFYRGGLRKFDEQDFRSSNLFSGSGNLLRPTVYANFRRIREHEGTHVDTLKSVIRSLGGRPVPEAEYNFNRTAFTSVEKFVSVAKFLENTGVSAYD